MEKRVKFLVCDSGAFIKSSPVHEFGENIYTVKGAVSEIKDKETLQRLQFLPYTLQTKEPSTEAFKYVSEFSKKTGDYANLSLVDLQIIALTYQLEKENVGTEHLKEQPTCQVTGKPSIVESELSGFYFPKEKSDGNSESVKPEAESESVKPEADSEPVRPEEEEVSDSDEESWITSSNFAQVQKQMGGLCLDSPATVACVTTDFCIQNVLIQMGLNVVSVDGMIIKQTRVYILRCYSCYRTTTKIEKKFCPNCGNRTLKRVAVTVNDDGSKNIHINFRRPIPIRGTKYSIPTPKGGKHSTDPVLCEDQPVPMNRLGRKAMQKIDVLSEDFVPHSSPFARNDVCSRAASLGIRTSLNSQRRKRNPNEWSRRTGNRK